MMTYLHDIRNKLTLISGHASILSKKYGEEELIPIKINIARITDLINDAYLFIQEEKEAEAEIYDTLEFVQKMDLITEASRLLFPIELVNEISDYRPHQLYQIGMHANSVLQIIENAIDNSVKAQATKVIIRIFESGNHCIYEIVDNGIEKTSLRTPTEVPSVIPHGLGKEIMMRNMKKMNGKAEWTRRVDNSGMIVRLYFPKKI